MNGFSWIKSLKINNSIFHLLILSISIYIKSRSTCQEVAPTPPPLACIYICPEGHSSMKEDETSTKQTNKQKRSTPTPHTAICFPTSSFNLTHWAFECLSLLQENFGFGKYKPRQFQLVLMNVYLVRNAIF